MLGYKAWMRSVFLFVPNAVCAHAVARDKLQTHCSRDTRGRSQGPSGGEMALEMSGDEIGPPNLHCFELNNGIRVDFVKTGMDKMCLNVSIDVGLAHTFRETPELAYLAKHMSTLSPRRCLVKHDLYEFYEYYCMDTTPSYTSFHVSFRAGCLSKALERLHAGISGPCLDDDVIKNEIPVIISELRFFYSDPFAMHSFLKPLCFEGGDYLYDPRSIGNTEDLLRSGPKKKLESFYERYYNAGGIKILFVGNCDSKQLQAHLNRTFGRIPSSRSNKPAFQMPRLKKGLANRLVKARPPLVFANGQCVSKLTVTFPELRVDSFGTYVALHMLKGFLLESHRGGFKSFLMDEKYAIKYFSSVCSDFRNSFYFEITIILTEKGDRRVQEIADFLSLYLGVWKRSIGDRHIETWRHYVMQEITKTHSNLSDVCSDEKVRYLVWLHNNFSLDDVLRGRYIEKTEKVDLRELLGRFLRLGDIHYVYETGREVLQSASHDRAVQIVAPGSSESANALAARAQGYFDLDKVFNIPFIPPITGRPQSHRMQKHLEREDPGKPKGNSGVFLRKLVRFAETRKVSKSGDQYTLKTKDGLFECALDQSGCCCVLKNGHGGVLKMLFDRCVLNSRVMLSLDYGHLGGAPKSMVAFKIILEVTVDRFLEKHLRSMGKMECTASFDSSLSPVFLAEFQGRSDSVLSLAAAFVKMYKKTRDSCFSLSAADLDRYKRLLRYKVSEQFKGNVPPIICLVAKEAFLNSHNILKALMDGLFKLKRPSDLVFSGDARTDLSVVNTASLKDSFKLFCKVGRAWKYNEAAKEKPRLFQNPERNLTINGSIGHRLHNVAAVLIKTDEMNDAESCATFVSLIQPYFWKKVRADLGEYHCSLDVQNISKGERVFTALICGQHRSLQLKDEIMRFVASLPALVRMQRVEEIAKKHGTNDGEIQDLRSKFTEMAEGLLSRCDSVFILMDKDGSQEIFMDFDQRSEQDSVQTPAD